VTRLALEPFGEEHVDDAAALLAEAHAAHRAAEPLLAESDPREALKRAWRKDGTSGVAALRGGAPFDAGVTVRREGLGDLESAIRINREIADTQALTPSFSDVMAGRERDAWIETLEDAEVAYFLAERDGRPVGHATLYPADPDLGTPPDAIYLALTATLPEARGSGAGLALTAHALAWARAAG
jgi:ribosomal protein S18 acetylase RimI-like enzyme